MSVSRKRTVETPEPQTKEDEDAAMQDLARRSEALSISEQGIKVTEIPKLRSGREGLELRRFDQAQSYLGFPDDDEEVSSELKALSLVVRGEDDSANLDKRIRQHSLENIQKILRLAFKEINEVLLDSIDELFDEASGLDIPTDDDKLNRLRNPVFHEDEEYQFLSRLESIEKEESIELVRLARCEIGWLKDIRDTLVPYVEFARDLSNADAAYELTFEIPARSRIELLGNEQRARVREGEEEEPQGDLGSQTPSSPSKRRKPGRKIKNISEIDFAPPPDDAKHVTPLDRSPGDIEAQEVPPRQIEEPQPVRKGKLPAYLQD